MMVLLLSSTLACIIPAIVMALAWVLSYRTIADREKSSPFECGFDPLGSARLPFSLRFFLLAVIFLIFDVEIVLLFPIISILSLSMSMSALIGAILFLLILIIGLLHEWREGSLDWAK
uniref:NADH-ubiquinone oxidoreductase chain 3 n=1 Tax=Solemya elarraichensis TaxID=1345011 RepID=A0A1W5WVD8_9BIVA|nr:NADH dehydrogenase subunit 3 [Solemya elarraichensis]ARH10757.1 NADH dehydrogenase subunit 3 [Solemya elarraichensis]